MDKKRPNFAEDLSAIRHDVTSDIGTILKLAKTNSPPATSDVKPIDEPVNSSPSAPAETPHRVKKIPPPQTAAEPPAASRMLENVTTRLTQETNEMLTEVALKRRLKKQTPDTRQSVIECALREYFERHGYTKPSKRDSDVANL